MRDQTQKKKKLKSVKMKELRQYFPDLLQIPGSCLWDVRHVYVCGNKRSIKDLLNHL